MNKLQRLLLRCTQCNKITGDVKTVESLFSSKKIKIISQLCKKCFQKQKIRIKAASELTRQSQKFAEIRRRIKKKRQK